MEENFESKPVYGLLSELKEKSLHLKKTSALPSRHTGPIASDNELNDLKINLKSTSHPHPNQLSKLSTLSDEALHSISHIIKKVISI